MELYEQGKAYWAIARRFNQNRANPQMRPVAVRDMTRLQGEVTSPSVRQRVNTFIARHHAPPLSISPNDDGPSLA